MNKQHITVALLAILVSAALLSIIFAFSAHRSAQYYQANKASIDSYQQQLDAQYKSGHLNKYAYENATAWNHDPESRAK